MNLDELLYRWGQAHLLSLVPAQEEKKRLLEELLVFEKEALDQEMQFFEKKRIEQEPLLASPWEMLEKKNELYRSIGDDQLFKGKTAALMLAAGEGSRLGFSGPKGCFPFSIVKQKSLFQIFCEKILASQKKYKKEVFLMIMTSCLNRKETELFFEKNGFFGLKKSQVAFFSQDLLPLCDLNGKWFLEDGLLASRANGNGDLYRSFAKANLLQICEEKGIEKILLFPVDNPLADPLDSHLLGFHEEKKCEVAITAIQRPKRETSMGVLAKTSLGLRVLEYMEISPKEMASFSLANTGLYCMSPSFLEKASSLFLPLHRIRKKIRIQGREKEVFKFERFLFDAFVISQKTEALLSSKNDCFAPLKRSQGKDGLASCRKAFLLKERKVFTQFTKKRPFQKNFELSQEFYYPTNELRSLYQQEVSLDEQYFKGIDL